MNEHWALQQVKIKNSIPLEEAKQKYKDITKKKPKKVRETKNFHVFRHIPPTKFKSKSFRTKVVNDDIQLVFGELKEGHEHLSGSGLFDYFKKGVDYAKESVTSAVKSVTDITDFSKKAKDMLKRFGDFPVIGLTIVRHAIQSDPIFNAISFGQWKQLKKKYGYDNLFHMMLTVTLKTVDSNKKIKIEQIGVISINENTDVAPGDQTFEVPMKGKEGTFTLNQMLYDTKKRLGTFKFFEYSAFTESGCNCQGLVANLLRTEGLYGEEEHKFVYQDVSGIYKEIRGHVPVIADAVTKATGLLSKYFNVGGNKITLNDLSSDLFTKKGMKGGMMDDEDEGDEDEGDEGDEGDDRAANRYVLNLLDGALDIYDEKIDEVRQNQQRDNADYYRLSIISDEIQNNFDEFRNDMLSYFNHVDPNYVNYTLEFMELEQRFRRYRQSVENLFHPPSLDTIDFAASAAGKPNKCWKGYEKKGTKMKNGKKVNNCVKTKQFLEYVKKHHHDLEAPHTLKQMYKDWKEMKGGMIRNKSFKSTRELNPAEIQEQEIHDELKYLSIEKHGLKRNQLVKDVNADPEYKDLKILINELREELRVTKRDAKENPKNVTKSRILLIKEQIPEIREYANHKYYEHEGNYKKIASELSREKPGCFGFRTVPKTHREFHNDLHTNDRYRIEKNLSKGFEELEHNANYVDQRCENLLENIEETKTPKEMSLPGQVGEGNVGRRIAHNAVNNARELVGLVRMLINGELDPEEEQEILIELEPEDMAVLDRELSDEELERIHNMMPSAASAAGKPEPPPPFSGEGNKSAGFIRAMMARESKNPKVHEKYQKEIEEKNKTREEPITKKELNRQKFQNYDREGFKMTEMSKTTHDVVSKKKAKTRRPDKKRFYDYVLRHAPQHQPQSTVNPNRNYRGTFDLSDDQLWSLYDAFLVEEKKPEKKQEEEINFEIFPEKEIKVVERRKPKVAEKAEKKEEKKPEKLNYYQRRPLSLAEQAYNREKIERFAKDVKRERKGKKPK